MEKETAGKKAKLENKIEKLAQDFFAVDKADASLARKRDRLKTQLWATMYEYYKLVYHAFINPNNKKSDEPKIVLRIKV